MTRHLPFQQRVLALVVSLLLFAQVMGLHRHQHRDAAAHGVQSALHFGDAGLHEEDGTHHHADDGAVATGHEHHGGAEVEVSALGDALSKLKLNLLPVGLLMVALLLMLLPMFLRVLPRPRPVAAMWRHPFALHPPANGPPQLTAFVD